MNFKEYTSFIQEQIIIHNDIATNTYGTTSDQRNSSYEIVKKLISQLKVFEPILLEMAKEQANYEKILLSYQLKEAQKLSEIRLREAQEISNAKIMDASRGIYR